MEIEVMGHKGQIYDIKAQQDGIRWPGEDTLIVFLSFDEPGEPAFGFIVTLPARRWSRADFLQLVKDRADDVVAEILDTSEDSKEHQRQWYERQKELGHLVDEIKSEIGLLP